MEKKADAGDVYSAKGTVMQQTKWLMKTGMATTSLPKLATYS